MGTAFGCGGGFVAAVGDGFDLGAVVFGGASGGLFTAGLFVCSALFSIANFWRSGFEGSEDTTLRPAPQLGRCATAEIGGAALKSGGGQRAHGGAERAALP